MTFFSLRFDWLCLHRRSVQGLERLWKPTPAIRSQQQSVKRRRWTLLTVTICLHVLLWSSVIPLITMIALFAAQKIDTTVLPSTVLTIVSVFLYHLSSLRAYLLTCSIGCRVHFLHRPAFNRCTQAK